MAAIDGGEADIQEDDNSFLFLDSVSKTYGTVLSLIPEPMVSLEVVSNVMYDTMKFVFTAQALLYIIPRDG